MHGLIDAMAGTELGSPGTAELGVVEVAEPEIEARERPSRGDAANDWLCAWCLKPVASEKDRFYRDGTSEFSFQNPEGMRFNILTFSRTIGCRRSGVPTLTYTWFPDHAWSFCLCDGCGRHLGWHYEGPTEFVGLIRNRIVRALLMVS